MSARKAVPSSPLQAIVELVREQCGPDAIQIANEFEPCASVPTGFPTLDNAIGVGGFPLAKLCEIDGAESTGKTTLSKVLIGRFQLAQIPTYYLGTEGQGLTEFDRKLGVDPALTAVSEPLSMEDTFAYMDAAIEAMKVADKPGPGSGFIVWDSVAATALQAELDRGYDEHGRMAERAGFLSQKLPKLVAALKGTNIGVLFVNQIRDNPGALPFEAKTYSPGGRALRHWTHLKLETKRMGQIKSGPNVIGIKIKIRVTKSKVGPPFREAHLKLNFLTGVLEEDTDARE